MGLEVIAIGLAVAGTVGSAIQGRKAEKAQKRARQLQERQEKLKQRREELRARREARIEQARIAQAGANVGASGSSAVVGGVASLQSQLSSNLSFLNESGNLAQQQSRFLQKAANAQARAGEFGAVANLGFTLFDAAGGSIFGETDVKTPLTGGSGGGTGSSSGRVL